MVTLLLVLAVLLQAVAGVVLWYRLLDLEEAVKAFGHLSVHPSSTPEPPQAHQARPQTQ